MLTRPMLTALRPRAKPGATLRRNLSLLRDLDSPAPATIVRLVSVLGDLDSYYLAWEPRCCSKPGCRTCPHGPYLFARRRRGGLMEVIYIGR